MSTRRLRQIEIERRRLDLLDLEKRKLELELTRLDAGGSSRLKHVGGFVAKTAIAAVGLIVLWMQVLVPLSEIEKVRAIRDFQQIVEALAVEKDLLTIINDSLRINNAALSTTQEDLLAHIAILSREKQSLEDNVAKLQSRIRSAESRLAVSQVRSDSLFSVLQSVQASTVVQLETGWNFVAYTLPYSRPLPEALHATDGNIAAIQREDGAMFVLSDGFHGIDSLRSGSVYTVFSTRHFVWDLAAE